MNFDLFGNNSFKKRNTAGYNSTTPVFSVDFKLEKNDLSYAPLN